MLTFHWAAIAPGMALVIAVACTGTPATSPEPATVAPATAPAAPAIPAAPAAPTAPAQGASAATPATPPAPPAPGAPPANAADFEPISTPLGPREGGGVKWGGVKTRGDKPVKYDGGEVYDPTPLPPDSDKR